jgi:uncharacterized protein YegJ (DUF2314 family)
MSYMLVDGVEMNRNHPRTFQIPSAIAKAGVKVGDYVKLGFCEVGHDSNERMWVKVTKRDGDKFEGYLDNDPAFLTCIKWQDKVVFESRHIINLP